MPARAWRCTSRRVRIGDAALQGGIERIGLGDPLCHDQVEITERRRRLACRPKAEPHRCARRREEASTDRATRLGALARRVDRAHVAANKKVVDRVLEVAGGFDAEEAPHVGLVLGEQQLRRTLRE